MIFFRNLKKTSKFLKKGVNFATLSSDIMDKERILGVKSSSHRCVEHGCYGMEANMRIDAMNQVSQIYQANRTKKVNNTNAMSFADTLELSQAGKDLQVAKAAVKAAPEVREDRIAEIKAAMESGTWSVSNNDLAEKLLGSFDI